MRVATYNVRHCEGLDGRVDPGRTARAIRDTSATVVALQELDRNLERSGHVDQPAVLEQLTGLRITFWPTLRRAEGEYGIGIAATDDVAGRFQLLHRSGDEEPRGAIVAQVQGLWVITAHLSRHRRARAAQLEQLAEMAGELDGPKLLLGDLNETPRRLGALSEAGFASDGRTHATLSRRRRQIDHVMAAGGAVVRQTWVVPSRASDHVPLVGEIEIQPPLATAGPPTQ